MKIKRIIKLTLGFLFGFYVGIQLSNAQEKSLLYKIEGENIKDSYLYGTFHILPQKDFELKEKVSTAFNDSELLVLELDMDEPNLQAEMMKNIMLPEGESLDQYFSEKDYERLDQELKTIAGVGIEAFAKMKPLMVTQMLLIKYVGSQPASFEGTFLSMAKENELEVLGLETIEEQMSVFDQIPLQEQTDDIAEMINDEAKANKIFNEMIQFYKDENAQGLYDSFADYYENNDSIIELMLSNRNKNWIPKIGQMAKDKKVFFGVGAGHLSGEEGVIQLLRNEGYKVTAL